jgi:hypothetical protein
MTNEMEKRFDEKFGIGRDGSPARLTTPSWQEWKEIKEFLTSEIQIAREAGVKEERERVRKIIYKQKEETEMLQGFVGNTLRRFIEDLLKLI